MTDEPSSQPSLGDAQERGDQSTTRDSAPLSRYIEPGTAALISAGLMLPIVGAIERYIWYAAAGIPGSLRLAVTAPVGELAALGAVPALLAAAWVALAWVWPAMFPHGGIATASARDMIPPVLVMALVATLLLGPVMALLGAVVMMAVWYLVRRRDVNRTWRTAQVAVVVFVILAASGVAAAWSADPSSPAAYSFSDPSLDGYYVPLAQDGTFLYLADCRQRDTVLTVPASAVISARTAAPTGTDVVASLHRAWAPPDILGLCP